MNKIWAKNFEEFLKETSEKELESYRQHNEKYDDLKGKRALLHLRSNEILRLLSAEEQKELKEFHETAILLCQMEKEQVYRQGHIDCIHLLQYLGLLEVFS